MECITASASPPSNSPSIAPAPKTPPRVTSLELDIISPAEGDRIWQAAQAAADAAGLRNSAVGRLARQGFVIGVVLRSRPGLTHAVACRIARQLERRAKHLGDSR